MFATSFRVNFKKIKFFFAVHETVPLFGFPCFQIFVNSSYFRNNVPAQNVISSLKTMISGSVRQLIWTVDDSAIQVERLEHVLVVVSAVASYRTVQWTKVEAVVCACQIPWKFITIGAFVPRRHFVEEVRRDPTMKKIRSQTKIREKFYVSLFSSDSKGSKLKLKHKPHFVRIRLKGTP